MNPKNYILGKNVGHIIYVDLRQNMNIMNASILVEDNLACVINCSCWRVG